MGCFLGCFGGAKDRKRRRQRVNKGSPRRQRNRVQNVLTAEQSITETTPLALDSEWRKSPEEVEQLSPSPQKRVTFNSDVTTYEHVSVHESTDSQPDCATNAEKEKLEGLTSHRSHSLSEDDNGSVITNVGLYPPNHRYHNARESDDEAEEYCDSDLDDDKDEHEDQYDEYDEDCEGRISAQEMWPQSFSAKSTESRTENYSSETIINEVEGLVAKSQPADWEVNGFGPKTNARDRSDVNSVLNPVENVTQWKTAKSKGSSHMFKPQKENLNANFDAPRMSFSSEPTLGQPPFSFKKISAQYKNSNQEIAVDTSLSNWLVSPELTPPKKTNFGGLETGLSGQTPSEGHSSAMSYDDRPILGALTVDELKQMSPSYSTWKSPSRSPDEMPIIGTVGTYWNHLGLPKHSGSGSSFLNSTSKYRSYRGG